MDNRPIGVFDSGLGGLTTVRQLRRQLPGENIVYFGDTGRVPYGTKSRQTLIKYARQNIRFLLQFDPKAIVVACNSADTVRSVVAEEFDLPVLGVVEPSALRAATATRNGRIGLIATPATIRSGVYEPLIRQHGENLEIRTRACPLFVPLVENGRTEPGDVVIETVVKEYLQDLKDWGCDTLVLGCTHYPLLNAVIGGFMGEETLLINSGAEAARALASYLTERDLLNGNAEGGKCEYYVSDSTEGFAELAEHFLKCPMDGTVQQVDIGSY
ncbi:MAG: glutamate racemase [Ruminococcaceae bacterium]|nr:glutamate racemase [Oscillospiraceae bacterium]